MATFLDLFAMVIASSGKVSYSVVLRSHFVCIYAVISQSHIEGDIIVVVLSLRYLGGCDWLI